MGNIVIKRQVVLVDPKFQFLFLGYMVLFSVVTTGVVFYIGGEYFGAVFDKAVELGLAQDHRFLEFLNTQTSTVTMYFSLACVFTTSALLAGGLFLSHRIAGPIYQLRKQINKSTESGELQEVGFRNGDYFQELADDYNKMVRKMNGSECGSKENSSQESTKGEVKEQSDQASSEEQSD